MNNVKILFVVIVTLFCMMDCTADKVPQPSTDDCNTQIPTYEANIKSIIDRSCAYSGCHLNSAPGVYTTYEGDLLAVLNSGDFRIRVITQRTDPVIGMPPNRAPSGRPQDLTEEELQLVQCWLDNGFPKN